MPVNRVVAALQNMLPASSSIQVISVHNHDLLLRIANTPLLVRQVDRGWPRQIHEALALTPRPDLVFAPQMSPGAQAAARAADVSWADESGAAEIAVGTLLVSRSSNLKPLPAASTPRWTPTALAAAEALLTGTEATVFAVSARIRMSTGATAKGLAFLESLGVLTSNAARGRHSRRSVVDRNELLDLYAEAANRSRPLVELRVGAVWRDPLQGLNDLARSWIDRKIGWAATGSLAAMMLAPYSTQTSPWEIYVGGQTVNELQQIAAGAELFPVEGGRLRLIRFPSIGTQAMSGLVRDNIMCVPWPRAYADLRNVGVRGEDAAEHLRQEMQGA